MVLRIHDDGCPEESSNEHEQRGLSMSAVNFCILGAGVGASAASVAVGRPVLESVEAAADPLVEIGETFRGKPRDGGRDRRERESRE